MEVFPLLVICLCFLPAIGFAQNSNSLDAYVRYVPLSKVVAGPGEIGVYEAELEYSYEFKLRGLLPVKFSLDNSYKAIENTTTLQLPARLTGLGLDLETTLPFFSFNSAYIRLGITPSFYADSWDFTGSNFRLASRIFAIYKPDERWVFLAGIALYPGYESEVLPILGFIYKPNDRLTFNIVPKRPNISYALNEKMALFSEAGFAFNSEYEVTKDSLKNVVLRYQQKHLGAGIKYKVNEFVQASISAGEMFGRSLRYRDSLGKVRIKDSAYVEARLELKI